MMSAESLPPLPRETRDDDWQVVRRWNRKKDLSPNNNNNTGFDSEFELSDSEIFFI